ncbi:mechanosensitive ion channel [Patescibacteria group bacterium]|nr:mechanosensitive ion channel [Patescibacteria group bacterium]
MTILEFFYDWFLIHGVKVIAVFAIAWLVNKFGKKIIEKIIRRAIKVNKETKDYKEEKKRENTLIKIFSSSLNFIVWMMALLIALPEFGINATPFLAGAGVLGLVIGMGSKDLIADFLSGLFIILENQYRIGDAVKLAGIEGTVKDMNFRRTVLLDKEGTVHYIPNGQIKITSNKSERKFGK